MVKATFAASSQTRADEASRVRLGAHPATAPEMLRALAGDRSAMVRATVAMNPAAPPEADTALARDSDERVRVLLAHKLGTLLPTLRDELRGRLEEQVAAALTILAEDAALRVRAALAEELKDVEEAPRGVILRLAHDSAVMVCEPILRFSPLLTTEDLLNLLAEPSCEATASAIAGRAAICPAVCEAIAKSADAEAIRVLLSNHSAQIREVTLDQLIARAVDNASWHVPLVHRPHLPPRAVHALSEIVATQLLETLAARGDLDPTIARELQARLTRRLAEEGQSAPPPLSRAQPRETGPRGPAEPLDAKGGATSDAAPHDATHAPSRDAVPHAPSQEAATHPPSRDAAHAPSRDPTPEPEHGSAAAASSRCGDGADPSRSDLAPAVEECLNEGAILAAIQRGDLATVATMLATAAAVPVATVRRAATLRSGKALVSLAWRAGLSSQTAIGLQLLLGRLAPKEVLRPTPNGGFPLSTAEMRWQLEFLAAPGRS